MLMRKAIINIRVCPIFKSDLKAKKFPMKKLAPKYLVKTQKLS